MRSDILDNIKFMLDVQYKSVVSITYLKFPVKNSFRQHYANNLVNVLYMYN